MIKSTFLLSTIVLALLGCEKPPAPVEEAPVEEPAAMIEETVVTQVEVEPTAEELPVPDDFADEAAESITDDNLESELAKLEAEMEAEGDEG